jgi:hypothetical protein
VVVFAGSLPSRVSEAAVAVRIDQQIYRSADLSILGSWVDACMRSCNAEGDAESGKMAKEAEVLAAINRKSKDTRADCYVMTTPQDTSEKNLLKGIQAKANPNLHSQIIKGVSAGSARGCGHLGGQTGPD